jgi:hypothetical protein
MILYHAMRKHGIENFTFEYVLECETLEELNERDIEFISKFSLAPNGYNAGLGGDNYEKTPETCAKISAGLKGKHPSLETRAKLSAACKGRKPSAEELRKRGAALKGRPVPQERRERIAATLLGRKTPQEVIDKRIKAATGKPWSEKKRQSMEGRKNTEETKKNMRDAWKGRLVLTDEMIAEIRLNSENLNNKQLSLKYNVSTTTIGNVIRRKGRFS